MAESAPGIDVMLRYLNEHGETDEPALAAELNTTQEIVDRWAQLLEKLGLAKRSAKPGGASISPVLTTDRSIEEAQNTVRASAAQIQTQIETYVESVNQTAMQIEALNSYVESAAAAYQGKATGLKAALNSINEVAARAEAAYCRVQEKREHLEEISSITDGLGPIEAKVKGVGMESYEDANTKLSQSEGTFQSTSQALDNTSKEMEKALRQKKGEFASILSAIRASEKNLRQLMSRNTKK